MATYCCDALRCFRQGVKPGAYALHVQVSCSQPQSVAVATVCVLWDRDPAVMSTTREVVMGAMSPLPCQCWVRGRPGTLCLCMCVPVCTCVHVFVGVSDMYVYVPLSCVRTLFILALAFLFFLSFSFAACGSLHFSCFLAQRGKALVDWVQSTVPPFPLGTLCCPLGSRCTLMCTSPPQKPCGHLLGRACDSAGCCPEC